MGGSSMRGGTWPGDLASSTAHGTGIPATLASDAVHLPSQAVSSTPMGNSGAGRLNVLDEPPAHISVRYMSALGMRKVAVPCAPGARMSVKEVLHRAKRVDSVFRQVSPLGFARVVGKRRVRMSDSLVPGDELKLNPPNKPFL